MDLLSRVRRHFQESANLHLGAAEAMAPLVIVAADAIVHCFMNEGKVLACGNGGSAADAQHLAAELVGRYERERPGLSAISLATDTSVLSALANDYDYSEVFSRQISALGHAGDVLVAISTSGNSGNIVAAVRAAREREMTVVALTGRGGGHVAELMGERDVHLCVHHTVTARIQEMHILLIHCLCDAIDCALLGEEN
jgi:D-sedoheptulose 7-phosphate isomerase